MALVVKVNFSIAPHC